MALNDKNIIITPNIGFSSDPRIEFRGADSTSGPNIISAVAYPLNSGTLSFEGTAGQLFSITNNLTSGSIFSVNDVSGIPSIDVNANGTVSMVSYGGSVGIGLTNPTSQLQLSLDSARKPSTNTWTITSDERIKEDIVPADLDICYNVVKSLPLKYYKWNDGVYSSNVIKDRHKIGWIAQDVESLFPKAVNQYELRYNKKSYEDYIVPAVEEVLGVITPAQPERTEQREIITEEIIPDCRDLNVDQIYAAMYGTIQKLISKIETLEEEVNALKNS